MIGPRSSLGPKQAVSHAVDRTIAPLRRRLTPRTCHWHALRGEVRALGADGAGPHSHAPRRDLSLVLGLATAALGALGLLGLMACPNQSEETAVPAQEAPALSTAAQSPKPTGASKLEGWWEVKKKGKLEFEFRFEGDLAWVRQAKDKEGTSGTLSVPNATRLIIKTGTKRKYFRYALAGDEVFIGRGDAHAVDDEENFSMPVSSVHRLVYKNGACTLERADSQADAVTCSMNRDGPVPILSFTSPVLREPGAQQGRRYYLVNNFLISETLYQYKATRVGAP